MIPSPDCACCYTTRRMRYRNWRVHSKLIEWRVELKKRRGGMTIGIEETEAGRALPLFRRECIVSCERITSPSTRPTTAQQDVLNPLSLSLHSLLTGYYCSRLSLFFLSPLFIRIEMVRRCRKSAVVNNSKVKATMRNGSKFNNWTTPSSPSPLLTVV